jgi:hypothetical protein
VLAFFVTFGLLLHEIKLRRAEARDEEMRQARSVWAEPGGIEGWARAEGATSTAAVTKPVVHNDSDETIRDIRVRVYDELGKHLGDTRPVHVVVSPRREATCSLTVDVPVDRDLGNRTTSAELFFTDADGRRWKRGRDQARPERQLEG